MLRSKKFASDDLNELRRLIRRNPWVAYVSMTPSGLVASHYPTMLDEGDTTDLSILTHLGRPDEQHHALGASEIMAIVAGEHGYISSSWYAEGDTVPTWNHLTAHLYGVPELLSDDENLEVLERLVNSYESQVFGGRLLDVKSERVQAMAKGTVGMRLRVTRFEFRPKLSQNKPAEIRENIMRELEGYGPFANAELGREMRRWWDEHPDSAVV